MTNMIARNNVTIHLTMFSPLADNITKETIANIPIISCTIAETKPHLLFTVQFPPNTKFAFFA